MTSIEERLAVLEKGQADILNSQKEILQKLNLLLEKPATGETVHPLRQLSIREEARLIHEEGWDAYSRRTKKKK